MRGKLNAQGLKLGDPNWSIVDRNVEGNGDSYLRMGPTSPGDNGKVPAGVGSLGMRTGSSTDKAAFGDQVDFAGQKLADIAGSPVSYSMYVTGEDLQKNSDNGINLQMEIDPNTSSHYSTLTFVPTGQQADQWTNLDAGSMKRWYLTGAAGDSIGCNQVTYCTLSKVSQQLPGATLYSVQFSKGKDFAFSGAVDDLKIGGTTYDFEPTGVMH